MGVGGGSSRRGRPVMSCLYTYTHKCIQGVFLGSLSWVKGQNPSHCHQNHAQTSVRSWKAVTLPYAPSPWTMDLWQQLNSAGPFLQLTPFHSLPPPPPRTSHNHRAEAAQGQDGWWWMMMMMTVKEGSAGLRECQNNANKLIKRTFFSLPH